MGVPYTYFIKWTELDLCYYGRRTAKNCAPSELFNGYYTSSKYVKKTILEHGKPDIIRVHKVFDNIPDCVQYETKFLTRVNAARSVNWLNRTNGDLKFHTTGQVTVRDSLGNTLNVLADDPRFLSGELVGIHSGKITVRDSVGNTFKVLVTDSRYLNGELIAATKGIGRATYIATSPSGEEYFVDNLENFCVDHDLSYCNMRKLASNGRIARSQWKCRNV